jgi:thiol:disulfide interchange protein DsbD
MPSLSSALLASVAPAAAPDIGASLAVYAWAFGQGVLVDLTPCVYPLIPITVAVFGAKGVSRGRALFLASAYVLGMATLYTSLGVVVALTGGAFGAWLGNPLVVMPIAALLVALATSMFGAFDVQLPVALQNRLNSVGGAGPLGAFAMGLVSGFISAPCTGPVLLSLLAYIAKASAAGQSLVFGGSLLFVYALGMGTLFFAVALGASLFRPGPWMEHVKSVFGIALLVMAAWFLRPIVPALEQLIVHPVWGTAIGVATVAVAVAAGAVHLSFHGGKLERARKAAAVGLATFGGIVTVNHTLYVPPMEWREVASLAQLRAALDEAGTAGKPVLIDFSATWCLPCKELELNTFHDERVEPLLARDFVLIKIDVTDPDAEQSRMKEAFDSRTLPSVVVYADAPPVAAAVDAIATGAPAPAPTLKFDTVVHADEFLTAITPLL